MIGRKERQIVYYYLNNIANSPLSKAKEGDLLGWVEENAVELFGIDLDDAWDKRGREKYRSGRKYRYVPYCDRENVERMLYRGIKTVRALLAEREIADIAVPGHSRLVDMVFGVFRVSPESWAVLRYMIYCEIMPIMFSLDRGVFRGHDSKNVRQYRTYSAMTGAPLFAVERIFGPDGELVRKGIVEKDSDGDVSLSGSFKKMIRSKPATEAALKKLVFGRAASASLTRDSFKYMAEEYSFVVLTLMNALKKRAAGVNILVYGEPGTGKTEMCKSIARDVGASLYSLSENGRSNDRSGRISELAIFQTLLANAGEKNPVILFDEAEDAFSGGIHLSHGLLVDDNNSKLYYNRMLEKNEVPVIWITNDISRMDPAYIRRFRYVLEVEKPDQTAREKIWKNICVKHRVKLGAGKIAEYAETYDIPPSFIDTAVGSAALIGADEAEITTKAIEWTVESLQKATDGFVPAKKVVDNVKFAPELLNTDVDLSNLADKLAKNGSLRFSLCLYGEPGTGKSAFARYLADRMGLKVVQKRASDLVSKWIGETEKNIARAFREARDAKTMLVFDEADSFLQSRKTAGHSWEISQVNEMLTQMESHPYPFVCTTNLMQDMDEASLRRFMFKVKHGYLKPEQVKFAFKRFFGVDIGGGVDGGADNRVSISHLTHLTPGDFAVVKGKREFLDVTDKAELVKMLELEQSAKGIKSTRMGFA